MFFKRLSRSRSNSQSYIDNYSPNDSKTQYDDYDQRPDSARGASNTSATLKDGPMFAQPQPVDNFNTPPMSRSGPPPMTNGFNGGGVSSGSISNKPPAEQMPDLLTRAFNEAVRPYTNRVEELENEVADLKAWVEQLEAQRREVHAWIDKRGLRPGKPLLHLSHVTTQLTPRHRRPSKHRPTNGCLKPTQPNPRSLNPKRPTRP